MKQEIKQLWTTALRSGEYQQGAMSLCQMESDGTKFCCLGVLTDLYIKHVGIGAWNTLPSGKLSFDFESKIVDGSTETVREAFRLPEPVRKWAGLDDANPIVEPCQHSDGTPIKTSLAHVNDVGTTFAEIANIIDAQL